MLKTGDLVYYKQSLFVISKIHRGNLYIDLNDSIKVVPVSQVKLLNLHQNLFHLSLLIHLCWTDDIKRLYLKRLAEKLPVHILKGLFKQLEAFGLTELQHKYFFDQLYEKWIKNDMLVFFNKLEEYALTDEEYKIFDKRFTNKYC